MADRFFVIGDTHGGLDLDALHDAEKTINRIGGFDRDDFIFQCGDFGFVWDKKESEKEKENLDYLENIGVSILAIPGNHDNYEAIRNNYPLVDFYGDTAYEIRPHIHIASRGAYYNINGMTVFCVDGAHSHDIQDGIIDPTDKEGIQYAVTHGLRCRINHISWWEEECPNEIDRRNILDKAAQHDYKADIILTHQPPISDVILAGFTFKDPDEYGIWIELNIRQKMEYKKLFSGHMHVDRQFYKDYILFDEYRMFDMNMIKKL